MADNDREVVPDSRLSNCKEARDNLSLLRDLLRRLRRHLAFTKGKTNAADMAVCAVETRLRDCLRNSVRLLVSFQASIVSAFFIVAGGFTVAAIRSRAAAS